jgi:glycogen debranching enzyme
MRYTLDEQQCRNLEVASKREWLLTNGIGGYAMGTVSGLNTRRYHGHLIAATHPPTGRMLLLANVEAHLITGAHPVGMSANQYTGAIYPEGFQYLKKFEVGNRARWRFRASGAEVEKTIAVHPGVNATTVRYRNLGKSPITITLKPLVACRDHHANFSESTQFPEGLEFGKEETVIRAYGISLYLSHAGAVRDPVQGWYYRFEHVRESERGLSPRDDLFCPCELTFSIAAGDSVALVASTEPGTVALPDDTAANEPSGSLGEALRAAAEPFFVATQSRTSIVAGYPWFTDWGRDTMISIPGLCLHTGRAAQARQILTDYAAQIWQGLIPNRFVERGETPDYNTVDATLWFANAIYKTLAAEWDNVFALSMSETLSDVIEWHQKGTAFGIRVDPADGLLIQGEPGLQLTWMDAKVGDWVVTPRHGKPVEINGLWINALRTMEWLQNELESRSLASLNPTPYREAADRAQENFQRKFWHEVRGHYLDTVDPADASLRPNQVLVMALPWVELPKEQAVRALKVIGKELLTPMGLRTLGPSEPGYRGRFRGPLPELDAAYHQGTVWPWLLGSYATAIVRYTGDRSEAKRALRATKSMLVEYGLGGIAEVYDGDEPQEPGGCPWQAWSVAETIRAWFEDCQGD